MALFQALYDDAVDGIPAKRFIVKVGADDLAQAKLDERHPGSTFVLTAIGQRTDTRYTFVYGKGVNHATLATS